ncbi:MAG: hypothetical protein DMG10_06010 [Acidobacteria bacterium]|nr:MAG: hypothetical protein DMG10_06010 [Acidobacteriota bacterium]
MTYYAGSNGVAAQYRLAGDPKTALPFIREGMNHMRRASELDPDDAAIRGHLAFALGDLAQLEAEVGNRREAEAAAWEAIPLANQSVVSRQESRRLQDEPSHKRPDR